MSESIFRSNFQAEKQVIQQGDNNTQNIVVKTEINYGDDPEEEKVSNTLNESSPYLGLVPFTASNSKVFYGRKKLIETLLNELEKDCLVFLLGASGSGKSSVVQAGLIPELSTMYRNNFVSFSLVPNKNPFDSFSSHLNFLQSSDFNNSEESDEEIVAEPDKSEKNYQQTAVEYLEKAVTTLKKNPESYWLIVIDQFEEILTRTEAQERFLFIQSLGNLISYLRGSENKLVKIILTMRIDFLDSFMQEFPDFVNTINSDGRKPFSYITPMTDRELKLVIKNPAATHGVNVDLDLIEGIINDFRGEARSLPLLQYTLDLLWKTDDLSDRLLNKETYAGLGGVGGALQQQAEKIYQDFEAKDKGKSVEDIFIKLVTITADGKRVSDRQNKSKFTADEMGVVDDLVKKHRLLVAGRQEDMVEIAHEALIGSWQRLQDWITKYEKEIILERQLKEAALSWSKDKADKEKAITELWTGPKLTQVGNLLKAKSLPDLNALRNYFGDVTVEFMRASGEYQQRLQKAEAERKQREVNTELGLANSLGRYSLSLFNEGKELDAFVEGIKAGRILQKHKASDMKVTNALQKFLVEGREYNRLEGHNSYVYSVSFSSDGKTLASSSGDETLKLWNVKTGQEIRTLSRHNNSLWSVSFSSDGKTLAFGVEDKIIKLWNVETGQEIRAFSGHSQSVYSVSFSRDGKTLASGASGSDSIIKLWNVETGQEICTLSGHNSYVFSVSFSSDSKTLASGSEDNTIKLWNVETGEEIRTLSGHKSDVNSVSFSSDGKTLASGSKDNTIKLWNVETGTEICTLIGHNRTVNSVNFSSDGKTLASGSFDGTIKLWNVETGEEIRTLSGHKSDVTSVSFSSDGKTLASASGSEDNTIKLWNVEAGQEIRSLSGHNDIVFSVSFSSDGKTLASGSRDETIKLWNVETGQEIRSLSGHNYDVYSVSFSSDGKTLASGGHDNTIKLWNGSNGWDLDALMGRSCDFVRAYLHNPNSDVREEDRYLCDGIGKEN